MNIRPATRNDTTAICDIYNYYIDNTIVTFEEEHVVPDEMFRRIESKAIWIVGEVDREIVGYAYAGMWRERKAYERTLESTVYLKKGAQGNGYGTELYSELIDQLRKTDSHVVIGGISLPNEASVRLHEKMGFVKVAHYNEVGYKFDKWIDVAFWQLILDR